MGRWAKDHVDPKAVLEPNAYKRFKKRAADLKNDVTPNMPGDPGDTPEEAALKSRQMSELAKLDDQENRRIKGIFASRQGTKLVRGARMRGTGSVAAPAVAASTSSSAGTTILRSPRGSSTTRTRSNVANY